MAEDLASARRDLEFLRRLTEESGPLLRPLGIVLTIAGVVHAVSALRFWVVAKGWMDWPEPLRPMMGLDAVLVQLLAMLACARLLPGAALAGPATGPAARAVRGAVTALGWALASALLGLSAADARTGGQAAMTIAFPVVLFALAGATWYVIFSVYRRTWTVSAVVASALSALAVGLTAGTDVGPLTIAAGLLICVAAPGLALIRQARTG